MIDNVVLSGAKKHGAELIAKSAKVFKNASPKIIEFTRNLHCKLFKACFPAGTSIAAKVGYKNIEDIQVGDLVWSWDALTGDIGLKPVIATMENETNTLIKITSGSETIHATPEHPFWVGESIDGAWKNAEDLTLDDELWLLDKRNKSIFSLDLEPQNQPIKVYNFEVADWHNYFVGMWMMLVHNSDKCAKETLSEIEKLRLADLGKVAEGVTNGISKIINSGKQGKHIVGHNNYQTGKSILSENAQNLLDIFHSGKIKSSQIINDVKTRVDFGKRIGSYMNPQTGEAISTTKGIIINSKTGVHIVPSAP